MDNGLNPLAIFVFLCFSAAAFALETFWIQEGTLKLKIQRDTAYPFNETASNVRFYYVRKGNSYIPGASEIGDAILKFHIEGKMKAPGNHASV